MYAIFVTGGKQYRATEGDTIYVEKLEGEVGQEVVFDQVLLVGDKVGTPLLKVLKSKVQLKNKVVARKLLFSNTKPRKIITKNKVIVKLTQRL